MYSNIGTFVPAIYLYYLYSNEHSEIADPLLQKTGKTFEVCKLQLPIIKLPSLKLLFEDHRTFSAPSAVRCHYLVFFFLPEDLLSLLPSKQYCFSNFFFLEILGWSKGRYLAVPRGGFDTIFVCCKS